MFEQLFSCIHGLSIKHKDVILQLSTSMGIAISVENDCFETLFARADAAVYKAKQSGKRAFCVLKKEAGT
ncbi:diguanylate cyclase domain-containing protein [Kurthia massiliensis]|uniref:diguanylate cyclase domain-containing protein n=1 Tax=Kurthia massiliensis TaxID=1033739 RepID=UPI001375510F|nr:diguanylate cyclase [Kurthia massiliensis]